MGLNGERCDFYGEPWQINVHTNEGYREQKTIFDQMFNLVNGCLGGQMIWNIKQYLQKIHFVL